MSIDYIALIVATLVLGIGAQMLVKHSYKKWNRQQTMYGVTGADAARTMLNTNGLSHVQITQVSGELSDHFDPRTNIVSLSHAVYSGRTASAVAIACHECGHAIQHAQKYAPAKVRGAIVPAVNVASNLWMLVLIAGIFVVASNRFLGVNLISLAVILFAAVLIFQLVTLPVEFNASKRALTFIEGSGWLASQEMVGAKAVLRSAAFTYVAAALASVLQLIYMLGLANRE